MTNQQATPDKMIGRRIRGAFEIRRLLGVGGMGCVYEGYQLMLERSVAIKVMSPDHARNPIAAEYFLREARSVSKLRHQHIIQILDFGQEDDETYFIVMEFVPGQPLTALLADHTPLTTARARSLLDQLLDGLEEAHANQVIHRDLKPDNLMIEQRRDGHELLKILDFGIAHVTGPGAQVGPMTVQGMVVGTPHYMSPEQARGQRVDARSDLFSVGAILYELLTGHVPFDAPSMAELLTAVIREPVVQPSARFPALDIDPTLEAICLRALNKDPALRYQSAADMRAALTSLRRSAPTPQVAAPAVPAQQAPPNTATAGAATIQAGSQPDRIEATPRGANRLAHLDTAALRVELVGERRQGIVLTLHQRTRGAIDAEALSNLYAQLDDMLARLADQTDATSQGRHGSWATLIFGAGELRRGTAQRAAQAAMTLQQAAQRLAPSGVAFGVALAQGDLFCPGGDIRRAAGAAIDAAQEGARNAADGEALILGAALQEEIAQIAHLAPSFQPDARVLGAPRELAPAQSAGSRPGLMERDAEIAAMLAALGKLGRSQGGALVMHGPPGVGSSAMLEELGSLAKQRGQLVLRASMRFPHQLGLQDVVRQWLNAFTLERGFTVDEAARAFDGFGLPPVMADLLARHTAQRQLELAIGTDSTASGTSADRALHAALRQLARAIAASRGLLLIIDDVDQLDAPLLDLLQTWALMGARLPIMLALAIRQATPARADQLPDGALIMPLSPLSHDAAMTFVRVYGPRSLSEPTQQALVRMSGGLPRHLSDLIRHVRMHPKADLDELERGMFNARELRDMLALRLYALTRASQYTIGLLSILGDGAHKSAVLALAQPDWSAAASLDEARAAGLIIEEMCGADTALYFSPPALGAVIYETLALKGRQRVHAQAAAYYAALRAPTPDALRTWSRQLEGSGDARGALGVLDRLIALERRAGQAALVEADQRAALVILSGLPDATPAQIAARQLQLAHAQHAQGRDQDALALCARLIQTRGLPDALRHEVQLAHAAFWLETEDPGPLEQLLQRVAIELERAADAEPAWLRARALYLLGFVQDKLGRPPQAARSLLDAIDVIQTHHIDHDDSPQGASLLWEPLWLLARLKLQQRDLDGAQPLAALAHQIAASADDTRGQIMAHDLSAQLAAARGRTDEASAQLDRALELAREASDLRLCARVLHNIGALQIGLRQPAQARKSLEASLDLANALGWREGIAVATAKLRGL